MKKLYFLLLLISLMMIFSVNIISAENSSSLPSPTPLEPTGILEGFVTECTMLTVYLPLEKVKVDAYLMYHQTGSNFAPVQFTTYTDQEGKYRFEKMPSGYYTIAFEKETFLPLKKVIFIPPDNPVNLNVCLLKQSEPTPEPTPIVTYGALDGHVIVCSNIDKITPIEGVKVIAKPNVSIDTTQYTGAIEFYAFTNADGYYKFEKLPVFSYDVHFCKEGFRCKTESVVVEADKLVSLDVCLEKIVNPTPTPTPANIGSLEGQVTECTMLDVIIPIKEAKVIVYPIVNTTDETKVATYTSVAYTDENGFYKFEKLPAMNYEVKFYKSGYNYKIEKTTIEPNNVTILNVCLDKNIQPTPTAIPDTGILQGSVTECSDQNLNPPIAKAMVKAYQVLMNTDTGTSSVVREFITYTNEEGVFEFPKLPVGKYEVKFYKEGFKPLGQKAAVEKEQTTVLNVCLIKCEQPTPTPTPTGFGSLEGVVSMCYTFAFQPLADVKVIAKLLNINTDPSVMPIPVGEFIAITGTDGKYIFEKLPVGYYDVFFEKEGFKSEVRRIIISTDKHSFLNICLIKDVEPTPTKPPEPTPEGVGGIHGFVFIPCANSDEKPKPVEGAKVILAKPTSSTWEKLDVIAETTTDQNGEFIFEKIDCGYYLIKVFKEGFHPNQKRVCVNPDIITEIRIPLYPLPIVTPTPPAQQYGDLAGSVFGLNPEGRANPIAGATVFVYPPDWKDNPDNPPIASATTDDKGRYAIPNLPAGSVIVVAQAIDYEREIKPAGIIPNQQAIVNFMLKPIAPPPPPPEKGALAGVVFGINPPTDPNDKPTTFPIAKAKVEVFKARDIWSNLIEPVAVVFTNEDGIFKVGEIETGKYLIRAAAPNFVPTTAPAYIAPSKLTFVPILLKPIPVPTPTPPSLEKGKIIGKVFEAAEDTSETKPIQNAMIICVKEFIPKDGNEIYSEYSNNDITLPSNNIPGIPVKIAYSDENGEYALLDLAPGKYLIICIAEKYHPFIKDAIVEPGKETLLPIPLKPIAPQPQLPGKISGIVLTPNIEDFRTSETPRFEPVQGTTITAFLIRPGIEENAPIAPASKTITNEKGIFVFENLSPGHYIVTAEKEGFKKAIRKAIVRPDKDTKIRFIILPEAAPIPEDSKMELADNNFEDDSAGWIFGTPDQSSFAPYGLYEDGMLKIISKTNAGSFGFWQSPMSSISNIPGMIYRIKAVISTDESDQSKAPIIRLRCNTNDFTQCDEFVITSVGDAVYSPTLGGKEYTFFFNPKDNGITYPYTENDAFIAFDVLNIDSKNNPNATASIKSIVIESILPENLLNGTTLNEYTFETDSEGWLTGGAPGLIEPIFSRFNGALTMQSQNNTNSFGYWVRLENINIDPAKIYQFTFKLSSDQTDSSVVPTVRCRVSSADQQSAVVKTITSTGDGENSPTVSGAEYSLFLNPQGTSSNSDLYIAVDMLNIDNNDSADAIINIENVKISSFDLPK